MRQSIITLAIVVLSGMHAVQAAPVSLVGKTPRQVYSIYKEAFKAGDVDTMMACVSKNSPWGKSRTRERVQELVRLLKPVLSSKFEVTKEEAKGTGIILYAKVWSLNLATQKMGRSRATIEFVKEDGVWKVADIKEKSDYTEEHNKMLQAVIDEAMANATKQMDKKSAVVTPAIDTPEPPPAYANEPYADLRMKYEEVLKKIDPSEPLTRERAHRILKLGSKYSKALGLLHEKLTKEGKSVEAQIVKKEHARLRKNPEVRSARKALIALRPTPAKPRSTETK